MKAATYYRTDTTSYGAGVSAGEPIDVLPALRVSAVQPRKRRASCSRRSSLARSASLSMAAT
jgi:hypothetical protein